MNRTWRGSTLTLILVLTLLLPAGMAAQAAPADGLSIAAAARSLTAAADYTWVELNPAARPMRRQHHAMTYDGARGTIVLFGGFGKLPSGVTEVYLNDTWEWSGANWVERNPTARPSVRSDHAMAYDSARGVVVLFGGFGSAGYMTNLNDTWEWNGTTWVERNSSSRPSARFGSALAYDSARGVVVLFGGVQVTGQTWTYLNDTWEWDGTNWTQRSAATRPRTRTGHAMAYDSARGVVVLFGGDYGSGDTSVYLNDTWEWDGTNWTQRYLAARPSARRHHAVTYDSERGVVILFGGLTGTRPGILLNDHWEWSGTAWTQRYPATKPQARSGHGLAYDSVRGVTVLFGDSLLYDTWEYGPASYCAGVTEIPKAQCEALVALYESTDGDNWSNNTRWLATNTPCSWYGVSCSEGNVTRLDLRSNQLTGHLPPEIGQLTSLRDLFLPYNALRGPIPPEIGNLTALRQLWFRDNQLSGTIPNEIGNLAMLTYINLANNQLTGAIPNWIGSLTMLTSISLSNNVLSGAIPPEIAHLTGLRTLDLRINRLTGPIPSGIGNLTALTYLGLGFNGLQGPIPSWIGNLTSLTTLHLGGNSMGGLIPPEIGNLTELTGLHLWGNRLHDPVPPQIGNLTNLTRLDLALNNLTSLPPEIGNLTALADMELAYNQLTSLPPEIGNLTALTRLSLYNNQLTSLPPEIGNLTALTWLSLYNNQLTSLPNEIGNLTALTWLALHDNQLASLPPGIGNLTALPWLPLHNNQLASLPPEIGALPSLLRLDVNDNRLTSLPPEMGNLSTLRALRLHSNPLSGEIPSALTSLSLITLTFYDTSWCVLPTGAMSTWLSSIPNLYGTGLICGEELSSLSGTVSLEDATSVNGIQVNLYRSLEDNQWRHLNTTQTVADGTYQFTGLGQGLGIDYRVQFVDPTHRLSSQYYDSQPTIQTATVIAITPGVPRTGIDAVLVEATLVFLPLVLRQP